MNRLQRYFHNSALSANQTGFHFIEAAVSARNSITIYWSFYSTTMSTTPNWLDEAGRRGKIGVMFDLLPYLFLMSFLLNLNFVMNSLVGYMYDLASTLLYAIAHPIRLVKEPNILFTELYNQRIHPARDPFIQLQNALLDGATVNVNVHNVADKLKRYILIPKLKQHLVQNYYIAERDYHYLQNGTSFRKSEADINAEIKTFLNDMQNKYAAIDNKLLAILNGNDITKPNSAMRPLLVKAFSSHPYVQNMLKAAAETNPSIKQWFLETAKSISVSEDQNSDFNRWFYASCQKPHSVVSQWFAQTYPDLNREIWRADPIEKEAIENVQDLPDTGTGDTWEQVIDIKEGLMFAKEQGFFNLGPRGYLVALRAFDSSRLPQEDVIAYNLTLDESLRLMWVASQDWDNFNDDEKNNFNNDTQNQKAATERVQKELLMRLGQNQSARAPILETGAADVSCLMGAVERIVDTAETFHGDYPIMETADGYSITIRYTTADIARNELLHNPLTAEEIAECRAQSGETVEWSVSGPLWIRIREKVRNAVIEKYNNSDKTAQEIDTALALYTSGEDTSLRAFTNIKLTDIQSQQIAVRLIADATKLLAKHILLNDSAVTADLVRSCQVKNSGEITWKVSPAFWEIVKLKVTADLCEKFGLPITNAWIQNSLAAFKENGLEAITLEINKDDAVAIAQNIISNATSTGVVLNIQDATGSSSKASSGEEKVSLLQNTGGSDVGGYGSINYSTFS